MTRLERAIDAAVATAPMAMRTGDRRPASLARRRERHAVTIVAEVRPLARFEE
jgi:hypothetical protein